MSVHVAHYVLSLLYLKEFRRHPVALCSFNHINSLEAMECCQARAIQASSQGRRNQQQNSGHVHALQCHELAAEHCARVLHADMHLVCVDALWSGGAAGASDFGL